MKHDGARVIYSVEDIRLYCHRDGIFGHINHSKCELQHAPSAGLSCVGDPLAWPDTAHNQYQFRSQLGAETPDKTYRAGNA